jgi:hypothetical protein
LARAQRESFQQPLPRGGHYLATATAPPQDSRLIRQASPRCRSADEWIRTIANTVVRATKDIDLLIDASAERAAREARHGSPSGQRDRIHCEDKVERYQVVRIADEIVADLLKAACVDDARAGEGGSRSRPWAADRSQSAAKNSRSRASKQYARAIPLLFSSCDCGLQRNAIRWSRRDLAQRARRFDTPPVLPATLQNYCHAVTYHGSQYGRTLELDRQRSGWRIFVTRERYT